LVAVRFDLLVPGEAVGQEDLVFAPVKQLAGKVVSEMNYNVSNVVWKPTETNAVVTCEIKTGSCAETWQVHPITPALSELHWLPVCQHVVFKLATNLQD